MIWQGKTFNTYNEMIDYALRLHRAGDKETLERFVEAVAQAGPYALQNVGYYAGYYDGETSLLIQELFKTAHPIFGRRIPSTDEALRKGMQVAREWREGRR